MSDSTPLTRSGRRKRTFAGGGVDLIAAERKRQVEVEDWTPEHDDQHEDHSLALAAACYAAPDTIYIGTANEFNITLADAWPWERAADKRDPDVRCWYPAALTITVMNRSNVRRGRIRELVKAGALIAAEIDRLQRLAALDPAKGEDE